MRRALQRKRARIIGIYRSTPRACRWRVAIRLCVTAVIAISRTDAEVRAGCTTLARRPRRGRVPSGARPATAEKSNNRPGRRGTDAVPEVRSRVGGLVSVQ
jgi:hypothetical protein